MKEDFDRKQGIGGSDATRIYNGNWYELYLEKIGEKEPDDLSDVLPVQMGIHTEDFNINWFEKQTGIKVLKKQLFITSKQYPFLYCNIDGVLKEKKALLECKHTNAFSNEVKTAEKYKAQIQHYLMVTGYPKLYFSAFYGNMKWEALEITADSEFQEQLLNAEVLFWHFVQTKKEPPEHIGFDNFNQKEFSDGRTIIPILSRA